MWRQWPYRKVKGTSTTSSFLWRGRDCRLLKIRYRTFPMLNRISNMSKSRKYCGPLAILLCCTGTVLWQPATKSTTVLYCTIRWKSRILYCTSACMAISELVSVGKVILRSRQMCWLSDPERTKLFRLTRPLAQRRPITHKRYYATTWLYTNCLSRVKRSES